MKARACVYCKKQGIFWGRSSRSLQKQKTPQQVMPHKEQFGSSMYSETSFGTPAEAPIWGSWSLAYKMYNICTTTLTRFQQKLHFRAQKKRNSRLCQKICFDGVDRLRYL